MQLINRLSSAPLQKTFLTGNPGQRITFTVRYLPSQVCWLADIIYLDFTVYGLAIVNGVNILRNYQNIIPFGLFCTTLDGLDPANLTDFETGSAQLYLLSQDETNRIELDFYTNA